MRNVCHLYATQAAENKMKRTNEQPKRKKRKKGSEARTAKVNKNDNTKSYYITNK